MSTTVRIDEEDKARLERIQEEWRRRTGKRPTLQRVIGALAEHGENAPDHLLGSAGRKRTPEEVQALHDRMTTLGGWTGSWEDIDAILYDEP